MKKLLLKSILLLCALVVGTSAWANTAGYTPSAALSSTTGTVTGTANETWSYSITFDNAGYYGYQASYGWQLGAGKKDYKDRGCRAFSISTSDITGTITKIEVEAGSYNGNSKINVTVGGSAFGTQNQATYNGQGTSKSTFTGSASGEIVISATDAVRAFYLKSITVTYTPSGGGSSVTAPSFEPGAGAITAGSTVTLTQADADAIRYTTDGTDPTITTGTVYTDPISITKATTIKAIAIKGEDVSTVATAAYTISVAYPAFNLSTGRYFLGTEITLTSAGNTIYYNMTTDGTTPSDPTNASTEYTAPIVLSSATTKIKAIAYDGYGNKSTITDRTYTGVGPATLPFTFDGKKDAIETTTGLIHSGLGSDYNSSPYLKFDNVDDYLILKFDGVPGTLTFDIKGNGSGSDPWAGTFTVQTSADGIDYSDLKVYTSLGSKTTEKFILGSSVRYIKWIYTTKSSGNVALGNINLLPVPDEPSVPVVAGETVTLTTTANMAGWRTFAPIKADQNYTVDGTTKVYYASTTADSKVTLTEIVGGVPANTPVILHQTSGNTITLTETATAITAPGGNLLQVSTASQDLGTVYRLGYKSTYGVGFYTYTTNSAPAGIIYLSTVNAAHEFLGFDFDGETTAINNLTPSLSKGEGEYYDLQGRKVDQPTKGLYIVNGKKVILH